MYKNYEELDLEIKELVDFPLHNIITLCGSTKFKKEFEEVNKKLTLEGNLVISVGVFGHSENIVFTEEEKRNLDLIHAEKIAIAEEIFVINVGGYIGKSTRKEIELAKFLEKKIRYLEEVKQ